MEFTVIFRHKKTGNVGGKPVTITANSEEEALASAKTNYPHYSRSFYDAVITDSQSPVTEVTEPANEWTEYR